MFNEICWLDRPDGARLAYHHAPAAEPRAVVVICHGLAEHSRRYRPFAEALAAHGFAALAHDHRGHGDSQAPEAHLGQFAPRNGTEIVVGDVLAMADLAKSLYPGLPVILFGHSMGGLIAMNTAEAGPERFAALAVWNSNLAPGPLGRVAQAILMTERAFLGSDVPSPLLPRLTFETWGRAIRPRRTLFDWLSHDPAEVDAYIADPKCGFPACISMWLDIFSMTFGAMEKQRLARLPKALPVLLVGGGEDPATDKGRAINILAKNLQDFGMRAVTTRIYPKARHETLNDTGRAEAISDFIAWCTSVLPPLQAHPSEA